MRRLLLSFGLLLACAAPAIAQQPAAPPAGDGAVMSFDELVSGGGTPPAEVPNASEADPAALIVQSCREDGEACVGFVMGFATAMQGIVQLNAPDCTQTDLDATTALGLDDLQGAVIGSVSAAGGSDMDAQRNALTAAMWALALRHLSGTCADRLVSVPAWKGLGTQR